MEPGAFKDLGEFIGGETKRRVSIGAGYGCYTRMRRLPAHDDPVQETERDKNVECSIGHEAATTVTALAKVLQNCGGMACKRQQGRTGAGSCFNVNKRQ